MRGCHDGLRGAINDETFGGLHLGCFRGSHFTKDQCKVLRNVTDPLLLVKCDGYCKCFFCHHFSRAWVFDAFYERGAGSGPSSRINFDKECARLGIIA